MTEQEWLACTDLTLMSTFLWNRATERKLRLFACACCYRIWHLIQDERSRKAVLVAERHADGFATERELADAHRQAQEAAKRSPTPGGRRPFDADAVCCLTLPNNETTAYGFSTYWFRTTAGNAAYAVSIKDIQIEQSEQLGILHDIFGNPFRPVTLESSWLTPTVTALAKTIYQDRAFDNLPILADALEEGGCNNAEILGHCRGPEPHCRGCFVVDLLLGKK